jgi:hypothetical protein
LQAPEVPHPSHPHPERRSARAPFDEELKSIVVSFAVLLRPIIDTVNQRGLKGRFLKKFRASVDKFFLLLARMTLTTEASLKCRQRFEKNKDQLFTFLEFDSIPWNNNNAEHAIKALARLRRIVTGVTTRNGLEEYLILLSICQTCEYTGLDFLDFLRSGEKDVHAFAENRRGRERRSNQSQCAGQL